ncbi:MAG TPA: methyltransferase domain-containing protein [Hanamia sp.]
MSTLKIINGFLPSQLAGDENEFEKIYSSLREKEGRILNEEEVAKLPTVSRAHPLYREWKLRKRSSRKLLNHIRMNPQLSNILEVGCGNGWLTALLATVARDEVCGIDVNRVELSQARKIFSPGKRNLNFLYGDIRSGILAEKKFDVIVFAASIQYFKSLKEIVNIALQHLTLQGEIHILDSIFYSPQEIASAKKRSKKYFTDLGFPAMSKFYFHHGLHELSPFNYSVLHDPHTWVNRLFRRKNPFYQIVIKNHYT